MRLGAEDYVMVKKKQAKHLPREIDCNEDENHKKARKERRMIMESISVPWIERLHHFWCRG
mgnify:CR=1 FL=1